MIQGLKLHAPNAGGLGLIPGQGTRAQMPQLRVHTLQLRPGAAKQIKLKILKKIQVNKQDSGSRVQGQFLKSQGGETPHC